MAGSPKANWIYLFHGEDELSSWEAVQGLVARMKDSPLWEYNIASFDGEKLALSELVAFCQTVPFMADKRLAIVNHLISRLGDSGRGDGGRDDPKQERAARGSKKALLEGILELLPSVPEFCRLVFVEEQLIPERDPILQTIRDLGGYVRVHRLEEGGTSAWIRGRASRIGCKFSPEAVEELAAAVGPNARLLNSEMVKLATYCGDRVISPTDVAELVPDARKANVFTMVEAVGLRQREVALRELRKLLSEGDHPLRVMAMVVRQFRLLIQVKELSEGGASQDEISRRAGVPFRGVTNLQRQARNFSFQQLEQIYRQLLDYDVQVKTGAKDPESALELLVAELSSFA